MTEAELCEAAHDAVSGLIQQIDPGSMVTRFLVVAEIINADGDRAVWMAAAPGQNAWDSLGLIDYARAREYAGIAREETDGD